MAQIAIAHPLHFYIDGQWTEPSTSSVFNVINVSSEEVAATVAEAQVLDVERAVAAARKAFDCGPWPRLTPQQRAEYLRAMSAEFKRRNDEFARIWSIESGVTYKIAQGRIGQFLGGAFNAYADMASTFLFEEPRQSSSGLQAFLSREPVGVVAAILPWNGPAGLMAYKCAPALLAGCTIILKSAPEAPCSAYILAEICEKVGLPAGVINILTAEREVSEALVRQPGVDKVTFTGSTAAGRQIASICGERIARVTLELGGKSPAIILDDYDVEAAAKTIAGGFAYLTGQVCHSLTRVIVSRHRHDAMVDSLCNVASGLKIGDPFDPGVDVGPLASARQRARVETCVARGWSDGAKLAIGGTRPSAFEHGFFFEPTVFGNVDNDSYIAREEIFGPVISVIPADDEDHAIRLANDTSFGLNASVFTADADKAFSLARKLRAGTVGHNASRTDFTIGFGGFKRSGVGREGGTEGLLPFLETKVLVLDQPYNGAE